MCGIVGMFGYTRRSQPVDLAEVQRINDAMAARGPDDAAIWHDSTRCIAFGHRRLAIIDITSSGAQPMMDEAYDLVVDFNGEIYNFKELRAQLETSGYPFKSSCGTKLRLAPSPYHRPATLRLLRRLL